MVLLAGAFVPLGWAEYNAGVLRFGMIENMGGSVDLYVSRWHKEPRWFDLERWEDFDAYIVEQEVPTSSYRVRILLYHGQNACLIEHEITGAWGGILSVTDPRSREIPGWLQRRMESDMNRKQEEAH